METLEEATMEEREELILQSISSLPQNPKPQIAHFLHPQIQTQNPNFPSLPSSSHKPIKPTFHSFTKPPKNYDSWLQELHKHHKETWIKSGIYEAILNSTFSINRNESVILRFVENWSCETNTFVFPFGEASITLEDVRVLGGFSVLGDSVPESSELDELSEKLEESRLELVRTSAHNAGHFAWIKKFFGTGSEIEHAAFLVLWLSRFVFPFSAHVIKREIIPIASRLSQGCRIALGPAVLAAIYRDLSFLKHAIVDKDPSISVFGMFQLVQVWIWERFPRIRPNPNVVEYSKPRFARWHNCNNSGTSFTLESGFEGFQWRPYCKYMKTSSTKEGWVLFDCDNDDLVEFTRICRASMLVGLKCVEQYLPHRTARQLGFDQDVPGNVEESKKTPKVAWRNYTRPVLDRKLYIPPRYFESGVTLRYSEWWNKKFGCESISGKRSDTDEYYQQTLAEFGNKLQTSRKKQRKFVKKQQIKTAEVLQSSVSSSPENAPVQNEVMIEHVENVQIQNDAKIEDVGENLQKNDGPNLHTAEVLQSSVLSSPYNAPVQNEVMIEHVENVQKQNDVRIEDVAENVQKNVGPNLRISLEARVAQLEKNVASIKAELAKQI